MTPKQSSVPDAQTAAKKAGAEASSQVVALPTASQPVLPVSPPPPATHVTTTAHEVPKPAQAASSAAVQPLTPPAPALAAVPAPVVSAPAAPAPVPPPVTTPAAPAAPVQANPAPAAPVYAAAQRSYLRLRHFGMMLSFLIFVVGPSVASAWYLWFKAADQFESTVGFSVHRESTSSAISMLAGFAGISGSSSADTDIIYTYIFSQQLVSEVNQELNLKEIWSKSEEDFVFTFDQDGKIEDLMDYWRRMVTVYYDSSTRLIEVRARAFTPEDAQKIADLIFQKSTTMINRLNDIASEDTLAYAKKDMETAYELVLSSRQAMTAFRHKYQIVDPATDLTSQSTIIATLEQSLAASVIELDILRENDVPGDPRIAPLEKRIAVIETRIAAERDKVSIGSNATGTDDFVGIVAEYERLLVDRQFAESAYTAARAAFEASRAEQRRQGRYLAAHVMPTLAESSRHPLRMTTLAVITTFLLMAWGIGALVFYSFRDRR